MARSRKVQLHGFLTSDVASIRHRHRHTNHPIEMLITQHKVRVFESGVRETKAKRIKGGDPKGVIVPIAHIDPFCIGDFCRFRHHQATCKDLALSVELDTRKVLRRRHIFITNRKRGRQLSGRVHVTEQYVSDGVTCLLTTHPRQHNCIDLVFPTCDFNHITAIDHHDHRFARRAKGSRHLINHGLLGKG